MNKYKIWGVIAGLSVFLSIFGYWAKITHQAYANKVITIGMWMLAVCAGLYVYFKVSTLNNKN